MDVTFSTFLGQIVSNPVLAVTVILALGAIFVNGWTDAPNAIATCVTTRCMPARAAILMSAAFNFLGVLIMTHFNASVANTISHIVDFGGNSTMALACLCAALFSIVVYGATASRFGIPTSQSHSLIAGLTGAAIALGGASSVNVHEWMKVIYGLALSIGLGFVMGWVLCKLVSILFAAANRRRANVFFKYAQIASAAAMSFMHGAQDGQKFIGVFLLGSALAQGRQETQILRVPLWLMVLCAAAMAAGTALGGRRIIDTVGREMVSLGPREGFSADLAGILCLLVATLLGLPVSTTHTRTAALLGVGAAGPRGVDRRVVRAVLLAWLATFPGCMALGYGLARAALARWS